MSLTGPPYPPPPNPGANAIGQLEIGVSQIGDYPIFDVWNTIESQYANSTVITSILTNLYETLDPTETGIEFFDTIWNVDTAGDFGLDIWGRIVGVSRVVPVLNVHWFGFAQNLPGILGWGGAGVMANATGAFFSGEPLTSNYSLATEQYRQLILAKAAFNITNGSMAAINGILRSLFPGRGNCYVSESFPDTWFGFKQQLNIGSWSCDGVIGAPFYSGQNLPWMTMAYVFDFPLSPVEYAIVANSGVLPRPPGVAATVVIM